MKTLETISDKGLMHIDNFLYLGVYLYLWSKEADIQAYDIALKKLIHDETQ